MHILPSVFPSLQLPLQLEEPNSSVERKDGLNNGLIYYKVHRFVEVGEVSYLSVVRSLYHSYVLKRIVAVFSLYVDNCHIYDLSVFNVQLPQSEYIYLETHVLSSEVLLFYWQKKNISEFIILSKSVF